MTEEFRQGDLVWYAGEATDGETVAAKIVEVGHEVTSTADEPDEHGQLAIERRPVYVIILLDRPGAPGVNVTDPFELSHRD